MAFDLSMRADDGHTVVALRGELDLASSGRLHEYLLEILTSQPASLIVDLSALTFMDSAGVSGIVMADRRARQFGAALALAAPQAIVARVLSLTGLDRHLDIYPTTEAAITAASAAATPARAETARNPSSPQPPGTGRHGRKTTRRDQRRHRPGGVLRRQ